MDPTRLSARLPACLKTWLLALLALAAPAAAWAVIRNPVTVTGQKSGPTPVRQLRHGDDGQPRRAGLLRVQHPAPGRDRTPRPISARYSSANLQARRFLSLTRKTADLPVFGLYANYNNAVTLRFRFVDGRTQENTVAIQTAPYKNSLTSNSRR